MENRFLYLTAYSLLISFYSVVASEPTQLPSEIMQHIASRLNPTTVAMLKQTCTQWNKASDYWHINPDIIEKIDEVSCTKMLSRLAYAQQEQNFLYFFKNNNPKKRNEALLLLGWPSNSNNAQLMQAYRMGTPFQIFYWGDWNNIFNNTIATTMMCLPDPNIQNYQDDTLLMWASLNGKTETVKELLSHPSIDVNRQNRHGNTALMLASFGDYIEIVKLLLAHPNINITITNDTGKTALEWTAKRKHTEIEQLLKAAELAEGK